MAYSKTPTQDTQSTERISITRDINTRAGNTIGKDEDFINVILEPVRSRQLNDNRHFIVKRAGVVASNATSPSGECRGVWFWEDQQKWYYAVGTSIYVYNITTGVTTQLAAAFGTSSGEVGFCEYLYDTNTVVIMATDGTTLNQITSAGVVTACVDADLPSPHLPYPIFLDGYLFLVKSGTADIYNSDLNNPLSWTAGNLISAEMEADLVVRIAKLNNYLVCFGKESIEYFWDAGNVSGSPMQRNDTPIKINTYLAGFAKYGNSIYYIGRNAGGQPDVFVLKDFKIESIGTPSVSRYLNLAGTTYASMYGNLISFQGHTFYVMTAGTTATYVCDVENKFWTRWAFTSGSTFPIKYATAVTSTNAYAPYFVLTGTGTTVVYKFDESVYNDAGLDFTCVIVTESSDFGSMRHKFMGRLSIVADRPPSNASLLVQWSDDDYQTYNTGVNINLNQDLPSTNRLGYFRQRNFKLSFSNNTLFRIQELEVELNKGSS
jgi:hypothetical protein